MKKLILMLVFWTLPLIGFAQSSGKITGCVTDESSGRLPGVRVEISGAALSKKSIVFTNDQGCYSAIVFAGTYQIDFQLPGFTASTKNGVVVFEGRDAIVDRTMRISLKAEMIVSARKPLRDIVEESDNLIGVADAASQGAVRSEQLALRPVARPGDLLESVPGVITSQHSGQGKANQYYLRGFNLDHGTDLTITVDGMPVNIPSNAHGQGYSDLSFLIPELVNDVQYQKGPYYAEHGDFASAGAVNIDYTRSLDKTVAGVEAGSFQYGRGLFLSAPKLSKGNLLFALDLDHNNGPWVHPDNYQKFNGLVRYSLDTKQDSFSILGMGYDGGWNSTDQIPRRAVQLRELDRFGAVDPTDGGDSSRYSLSADWKHSWKDALTDISTYVIRYKLDLFSNFTYFLDDPINGDQFEQLDDRTTSGTQVLQRWLNMLGRVEMENQAGFQFRNDDIGTLGLYHTKDHVRLSTTREDQVMERSFAVFYENNATWTPHFRTLLGLRADHYNFDVASNIDANSGNVSDSIVSPKFGLVFGPWRKTEFYLDYGLGFHSNDARGTTIHVDPVTGEPAQSVDPLARSKGGEWGMRSSPGKNYQTTFTLWLLDFDSELLFVGDAGITEPGRPSRRTGFEWNNHYKPLSWMTVEWNWAYSRARFRDSDPAGNRIPGAVEGVFTGSVWMEGLPIKFNPLKHTVGVLTTREAARLADSFWGRLIIGLQLRYFGSRPLIEDNSVRSNSSTLVSLSTGYRISKNWNAFADVFNLFNSKSSDIDYYYTSRLPGEPLAGIADIHTHPVEPISMRLSLTLSL